MSGTLVGSDIDFVRMNIVNSIAPATMSAYSSAWRLWLSHLVSVGENQFAFSEKLVLSFLNNLLASNLSWSQVNKILAGISFFGKLNNLPSCSSFLSVHQALKGYKRGTQNRDNRMAITPLILTKLCSAVGSICFSRYEASLFRALFSLLFFGAFRISELVAPNKKSESNFKFEHMIWDISRFSIFVPKSKTDQAAKGTWLTLHAFPDSPICPVRLVGQFLQVRGAGGGSFFIHDNGIPLSVYQFNTVFRKCLTTLNLGGLPLSSHSFRIGAATEAARLGLDVVSIKRIGRWQSDAYKLYIRPHCLF